MRRKIHILAAFTLLELVTVVVVIAILATLVLEVSSEMWKRAEKASCTANLRALHLGCAAYIQDNRHWPQIEPALIKTDSEQYAKEWIKALEPYKIGPKNWICPTTQKELNNPDFTKPKNIRVDYLACPFDDKQMTPYRYSRQPWFIERGAVHLGGNLIIFTDGQVVSLTDTWGQQGSGQ